MIHFQWQSSWAIALGLVVTACGSAPTPEASTPASTPAAASPTAASPESLQPKVELGTLQSLQVGDRGCYVEVRSSDGSLANVLGSFELCDATAAVGQEARLYYEPQTVAAATCQGDPECQDQETVLVLLRAEVIGAAAAAAPGSPGSPSAARPNPVNPASSVIVPDGKYMGVAATGEDVYYHGISFQCGDLPLNDPCWGQPNISYTIGNDEVFGLVDCQAMVLTEAWVGGERVAQNLAPQSPAMAEMLSLACYEALG